MQLRQSAVSIKIFIRCTKIYLYLLFSNQEAIETAEVATRIVIFDYSKVVLSFNCFTVPMAGEKCFQPIEINSIEDTALIIYTHGSTGLPMGTCLSHKAILHQAMHFR